MGGRGDEGGQGEASVERGFGPERGADDRGDVHGTSQGGGRDGERIGKGAGGVSNETSLPTSLRYLLRTYIQAENWPKAYEVFEEWVVARSAARAASGMSDSVYPYNTMALWLFKHGRHAARGH